MEKEYEAIVKNRFPSWSHEWASNRLANRSDVSTNDLMLVADWLKWSANNTHRFTEKLYKMTWEHVMDGQIAWHQSFLNKKEYAGNQNDIIPVHEYENGWKWVLLDSQEAYVFEGDAMGHCVGTYGFSCDDEGIECSREDSIDIYSLRDPQNMPHVTVEVCNKLNNITQVQGKGNTAPELKYISCIFELVEARNIKSVQFGDSNTYSYAKVGNQIIKFDAYKTLPAELVIPKDDTIPILGRVAFYIDTEEDVKKYQGKYRVYGDCCLYSMACCTYMNDFLRNSFVQSHAAYLNFIVLENDTFDHIRTNEIHINITTFNEELTLSNYDYISFAGCLEIPKLILNAKRINICDCKNLKEIEVKCEDLILNNNKTLQNITGSVTGYCRLDRCPELQEVKLDQKMALFSAKGLVKDVSWDINAINVSLSDSTFQNKLDGITVDNEMRIKNCSIPDFSQELREKINIFLGRDYKMMNTVLVTEKGSDALKRIPVEELKEGMTIYGGMSYKTDGEKTNITLPDNLTIYNNIFIRPDMVFTPAEKQAHISFGNNVIIHGRVDINDAVLSGTINAEKITLGNCHGHIQVKNNAENNIMLVNSDKLIVNKIIDIQL